VLRRGVLHSPRGQGVLRGAGCFSLTDQPPMGVARLERGQLRQLTDFFHGQESPQVPSSQHPAMGPREEERGKVFPSSSLASLAGADSVVQIEERRGYRGTSLIGNRHPT